MNIWQRKLLAFLHDPPHKALDIAGHEEARGAFLRQAGFTDPAAIKEFDKLCDATAAAADRFPFPSHHHLKSEFKGDFRHPLGGATFRAGEYQSAALAEDHYQTVQKGWHLDDMPAEMRDRANFFLHWRRWPVETAQKDFRSYFLPADTRMPDHNIWIHNSLTSALQACVADDGTFAPAFLVFQMGPVQEFIAQARSTRDLWSGSYLLSWLMAHAIKAITDKVGPDAVIFPFLRAQPIFDLLHRDDIYLRIKYGEDTLWKRLKEHENEMLIPNLPNRFFAVVPADGATDLANGAKTAVNDELKCIASACWDWFIEKKQLRDDWRKRYDAQVERFAQVTWQVIQWTGSVESCLADFAKFGGEAARNLAKLHELATKGIKEERRNERYFSDKAKTKLRNAAFDTERRIGIGIDAGTGAAAEHQIYAAEHLRLRPGVSLWFKAALSDRGNEKANNPVSLDDLDGETVALGGESRLCRLKTSSDLLNCDAIQSPSGRHIKWVLVTPAVFLGGWRPNWVDEKTGSVLLRNGGIMRKAGEDRLSWRKRVRESDKINAFLVAACLPKPVFFSGWDLNLETEKEGVKHKTGGPKPTMLAVPAGSVYYFRAVTDEDGAALVSALHSRTLSDCFGEKGMGLGVCGTWASAEDAGSKP